VVAAPNACQEKLKREKRKIETQIGVTNFSFFSVSFPSINSQLPTQKKRKRKKFIGKWRSLQLSVSQGKRSCEEQARKEEAQAEPVNLKKLFSHPHLCAG
jgi:hypothetical protein